LPTTVKEITVNLNIAEQEVFENIDSIAKKRLSGLRYNREQTSSGYSWRESYCFDVQALKRGRDGPLW